MSKLSTFALPLPDLCSHILIRTVCALYTISQGPQTACQHTTDAGARHMPLAFPCLSPPRQNLSRALCHSNRVCHKCPTKDSIGRDAWWFLHERPILDRLISCSSARCIVCAAHKGAGGECLLSSSHCSYWALDCLSSYKQCSCICFTGLAALQHPYPPERPGLYPEEGACQSKGIPHI